MFYKIAPSIVLLLTLSSAHAQPYFLCGPDEDGCPEGDEQYCACIPANPAPDQPFCLDFDAMTCAPLTQHPDCVKELTFPNQQSCLATIFQSEPEPPCTKVSHKFCRTHFTYLCDASGNPDTCKKQTKM